MSRLCNSPAEFAARLPSSGRIMAIDPGSKSIGLALSDEGRLIASPLQQLVRPRAFVELAGIIADLATQHFVVGIVIGYPLHLSGQAGDAANAAAEMARGLSRQAHLFHPIPWLCLYDERLSTAAVSRDMIERADMSRQKRAAHIDKVAASYMLQGCLDYLRMLPR